MRRALEGIRVVDFSHDVPCSGLPPASSPATSGMMSLGGDPDGPPRRVGFPVVDTLTGQTAALAILAALFRRERGGEGEYLDVAMFDATDRVHDVAVVPYLVTGRALEQTGLGPPPRLGEHTAEIVKWLDRR